MAPKGLAEQRGPHGLPERSQLIGSLHRPLAGFGVPLPQKRDDDLLNQAQFTVCGVPVEAQVARLDPKDPNAAARLAIVSASSS